MANKAGKKFGTVVTKCNCVSKFQDKEYGAGNRLANVQGKGTASDHTVNVRCTICLKSTEFQLAKVKEDTRGNKSEDNDAPVFSAPQKIKAGKAKDDQRDKKAQKGRKG